MSTTPVLSSAGLTVRYDTQSESTARALSVRDGTLAVLNGKSIEQTFSMEECSIELEGLILRLEIEDDSGAVVRSLEVDFVDSKDAEVWFGTLKLQQHHESKLSPIVVTDPSSLPKELSVLLQKVRDETEAPWEAQDKLMRGQPNEITIHHYEHDPHFGTMVASILFPFFATLGGAAMYGVDVDNVQYVAFACLGASFFSMVRGIWYSQGKLEAAKQMASFRAAGCPMAMATFASNPEGVKGETRILLSKSGEVITLCHGSRDTATVFTPHDDGVTSDVRVYSFGVVQKQPMTFLLGLVTNVPRDYTHTRWESITLASHIQACAEESECEVPLSTAEIAAQSPDSHVLAPTDLLELCEESSGNVRKFCEFATAESEMDFENFAKGGEYKGVTITKKLAWGESLVARGQLNLGSGVTIDEVVSVILDVEQRNVWDDRCIEGKVLEKYPLDGATTLALHYSSFKGSWGLKDRDAVYLVKKEKVETWRTTVSYRSLDVADYPEKCFGENMVRATITCAGFDVIKIDNGDVFVTMVAQVDLNGFLPAMFFNKPVSRYPQILASLEQRVDALQHAIKNKKH